VYTGRTDEAIEHYLQVLTLSNDTSLQTQTRVNLARAYLTKREIAESWKHLHIAFADVGIPQSNNKVVHVFKTLLDWFRATILSKFRTASRGDAQILKTQVQCYEVALQCAYFKLDSGFLLYGLQSLWPALGIGP